MANGLIEPLAGHHQRDQFCCGQASLDAFLRTRASQYEKRRLGKTFVAVQPPETRVLGYYTLAAGAVAFERMPPQLARKLPEHPVPIILLARLAVDESVKGQGWGERLLLDALQRSLDLSRSLGVYAVAVDAINDSAAQFYLKYGFTSLPDNPHQLFLPLSTIEDLLE